MKRFAALIQSIEETNKNSAKIALLAEYFRTADEHDALWVVALLSGRSLKRFISSRELLGWAAAQASIPEWLAEESYEAVGDLAETVALLLPTSEGRNEQNLHSWIGQIDAARHLDYMQQKVFIEEAWSVLSSFERFVFNKLLTGGFRIGVSSGVIVKALALATQQPESVIAHRLTGDWSPEGHTLSELVAGISATEHSISQPYPFFLAYPLEGDVADLGSPDEWQIEWKWDGIRAQVIKREGQLFIWSRGEELITAKFPELHGFKESLPNGTVLDGEIMCWGEDGPLPFQILQQRIGRKNISKKVLTQAPAIFMAYDFIEEEGNDIREQALVVRRAALEKVHHLIPENPAFRISEILHPAHWEELREARSGARAKSTEGVMLKRRSSHYQQGRRRGDWWKWKLDPFSVDAVLVYAQKGHGRRASLYTDYTFAVWDKGALVPFAKAYSGLTDQEIREVDAFIRKHTREKFGPVRTVEPELVFEIGFEGIQESRRHKSGVAVRFPRMLRRRFDKTAKEADSIDTLRALL